MKAALFRSLIALFCIFNAIGACPALPVKEYIPVPFLCQAPYGDWREPWQDACEEASVIMAVSYLRREHLNKRIGEEKILAMISFEGANHDLSAAECVALIDRYYGKGLAQARYDVTIKDIKRFISEGRVVICPVSGRLLGNPYYTQPGPRYHYIVFKGYDDRKGEFVVNDCGTWRGRNYRYRYETAMRAIHDWTGNLMTVTEGGKAAIVFRPRD